ncbi:capsule biosynthesis protein [Rhodovulum adriaticum]|uniref:Capsular polysaccharide export protein n=1 Tax=Rhodovulum adriaticum TaxID=35804 RepID=A0A4R2NLX0_RHOAD|nr:capsular biosynthesis protein [Rhodovulum adriaticum]MBK1636030.1 capsule biosynthesis protein CapA [Rhodovulum adriaticum]TCP22462.1 capsular polysaccharide export protein [Rhodovulum adriaticum]
MKQVTGENRRFLFLQGPHGPFFDRLAGGVRAAGAQAWRVAFNRGDEVFWSDADRLIRATCPPADWPALCADLLAEKHITDIALYGDTRPCHEAAIAAARAAGITVHIFEEGYLRPYWITYERDGANGHSRLMDMSIAEMRARLRGEPAPPIEAPAHWGDMRQHVFYGALYHWFVLAMNRRYPHFQPHRGLPVRREFALYLQRLGLLPLHAAQRFAATRAVRAGGFPYHLVLLQLAHDASFQRHGPFDTMDAFLALCVESFALGAPAHHHLVFKAHPLEDGRSPQRGAISRLARRHGVAGRVHYVRGGKLALLLDGATSAVTVNSTAGQQALWRGLPLAALGTAIYGKPGLVSGQPLAEFFAAPRPPDAEAYAVFRRFLLETSQVPGGYYSRRGRAQALRRIVDMVLAADDPYTARALRSDAEPQHLRLVR